MGDVLTKEIIIISHFKDIKIPNDIIHIVLRIMNTITTKIIYFNNQNNALWPSSKTKFGVYPLGLSYDKALYYSKFYDIIITHQGNRVTRALNNMKINKSVKFISGSTNELVIRYKSDNQEYKTPLGFIEFETLKSNLCVIVENGKRSFHPLYIFTYKSKRNKKIDKKNISITNKNCRYDYTNHPHTYTYSSNKSDIILLSDFNINYVTYLNENTISFNL